MNKLIIYGGKNNINNTEIILNNIIDNYFLNKKNEYKYLLNIKDKKSKNKFIKNFFHIDLNCNNKKTNELINIILNIPKNQLINKILKINNINYIFLASIKNLYYKIKNYFENIILDYLNIRNLIIEKENLKNKIFDLKYYNNKLKDNNTSSIILKCLSDNLINLKIDSLIDYSDNINNLLYEYTYYGYCPLAPIERILLLFEFPFYDIININIKLLNYLKKKHNINVKLSNKSIKININDISKIKLLINKIINIAEPSFSNKKKDYVINKNITNYHNFFNRILFIKKDLINIEKKYKEIIYILNECIIKKI